MQSQTFSPVSTQRWFDIRAAFQQQAGVTLPGDSGSTSSHGITFSWAYANESLTVNVINIPWYLPVSESDVMSKFSVWIAGVQ